MERVRGFGRDHPWVRAVSTSAALRELLFLAAGYLFYTLARLVADDDVSKAQVHAEDVVRLERHLGLGFEHSLNAGLTHLPFVIQLAACVWYASLHYLVTPAALFLLWRRRPEFYNRARWVLVLATVVALCVYLTYPVAPPRLTGTGFTDVMFNTSRWGWWGADASAPRGLGVTTNELAAMPSMHVGWAVWSAWALSHVTERRWLRIAVWAYPVTTALVVISTGNHWVLDVVAGAALVAAVVAWLGEPERRSEPVPAVATVASATVSTAGAKGATMRTNVILDPVPAKPAAPAKPAHKIIDVAALERASQEADVADAVSGARSSLTRHRSDQGHDRPVV
jgi:membrane-associated phospholipid phosphatase